MGLPATHRHSPHCWVCATGCCIQAKRTLQLHCHAVAGCRHGQPQLVPQVRPAERSLLAEGIAAGTLPLSYYRTQYLLLLVLIILVNQRPALSKLCSSRHCTNTAEARVYCSQRLHSVSDCYQQNKCCSSMLAIHQRARCKKPSPAAPGTCQLSQHGHPPAGSGAAAKWQGTSMPIAKSSTFDVATRPVWLPTCRKCCCSMPARRVPARASIVCLLLSFSCPSCLRAPGLRRVASSGAPSCRRTLAGWAAWYSGPTSCSRLPNKSASLLTASMSCLQSTGISAALPIAPRSKIDMVSCGGLRRDAGLMSSMPVSSVPLALVLHAHLASCCRAWLASFSRVRLALVSSAAD